MIETILTAILAFISTNIDDIFILMAWFTQTSDSFKKSHILTGQYLGIIALVVLSVIGSLIGFVIPETYLGLLGLFPIYLGLMKVYRYLKDEDNAEEEPEIDKGKSRDNIFTSLFSAQALNVAGITIANGGDNVGIYIPLFATFSLQQLMITTAIFLFLVFLLVKTADYLTTRPYLAKVLKKYNHILFPLVLVALGIYILIESKTYTLLIPEK